MTDPILILTYISIIFLMGILVSIFSKKFKIPNILPLLLIGIIFNRIEYQGSPLIEFPPLFLTSIGILALAMIVFDAASRFKLDDFDAFSLRALKLTFFSMILNMVFMSIFVMLIFDIKSVHIAMIFAALMSGTAPDIILTMFSGPHNRVMKLIEVESILNTPLMVLIPFIIVDFFESTGTATSLFIDQVGPFLQQIVVGIGSGVLVGLVIFKFMRNKYSDTLSPLAILTTTILTYILAENLGGNGVLAVTVLGLFFGSIYVKGKFRLQEFSLVFSNALEILVFVLIGLIITVPFTMWFFAKSILLFVLLIAIRFLAIQLSFHSQSFNFKEKIFMAMNVQKGIAVAVTTLTLSTLFLGETTLFNIVEMDTILQLSLTFIVYSILLSTVLTRLSSYFLVKKEG